MGYDPNDAFTKASSKPNALNESALVSLYEISKLLTTANPIEKTLSSVATLLASFLDLRHGLIALLDSEGEPELVVGAGWSEASKDRFAAHLPRPVVCQIFRTGMPVVIENVLHSPLFSPRDLAAIDAGDDRPLSMIGVPIKDGARVVGTLTADRALDMKAAFHFDRDVRLLVMVANLIGQTLRLHRYVAEERAQLMLKQARIAKSAAVAAAEAAAPIPGILGESEAIRAVFGKIRIVAKSRSTVMLRGETGVGKEAFAAAIHRLSPRSNKPFVKLNCAVLSESVLESELFGHERGAFTGAIAQHKGRFELADGGTLFLDEIGEIDAPFQAKLLRVLQEGEFERVGGSRTIKVDVRLICATNRDLEADVQKHNFREDLYYRLSVVPMRIPPLREREGDVAILAEEFLRRFNAEQGTQHFFTPAALERLARERFPGNIRELENCVLRTATLATADAIDTDDLSLLTGAFEPEPPPAAKLKTVRASPQAFPTLPDADLEPHLCAGAEHCTLIGGDPRTEREKIIDALNAAGWVKAKAARLLKITPRQIGYAMQKHEIEDKKF